MLKTIFAICGKGGCTQTPDSFDLINIIQVRVWQGVRCVKYPLLNAIKMVELCGTCHEPSFSQYGYKRAYIFFRRNNTASGYAFSCVQKCA